MQRIAYSNYFIYIGRMKTPCVPTDNPQHTEKFGITLLSTVALIWGTGFIATQIALDHGYTAPFIMMGRFVTAAFFIGLIFYKDLRNLSRADLVAGGVVGGFLFLGFTLQTYGLMSTTPSNSAFITATKVMMVPLLGWIFLQEKPSGRTLVAALACLVGITVLSMDFSEGLTRFGSGELLTFFCAVSFAFHTFSLGYFVQKAKVKRLIFLQLAVAALLSTGLYLLVEVCGTFGGGAPSALPETVALLEASSLPSTPGLPSPTPLLDVTVSPETHILGINAGLFAILYLGLLATGVAYILQTVGQKYVPASKAALVIATESLFASLLSVALGFESVSLQLLVGGGLIVCSIFVTEIRWVRLKREKT